MEQVQAADDGMLLWVGDHHQSWLDMAMKALTHLGDKWTVIAVLLAALLAFWCCGRRRTALIVLATSLLALGLAQGVKYAVNRPRPDVSWRLSQRPVEPSFPSGHALNSMAIYGALGLTASRGRHRAMGGLLIALGLGLPVLIGITRPYIGVHYPSDVVVGWLLGLACALTAYWADQRGDTEAMRTPLPTSPER